MHPTYTLTQLAERFAVARIHVKYAVDTYGPAPFMRVGTTRLWSADQLDAVRDSLARTAARSTLPQRRQSVEA